MLRSGARRECPSNHLEKVSKMRSGIGKWFERIDKRIDMDELVDISYVYKENPMCRPDQLCDEVAWIRGAVLKNSKKLSLNGFFEMWKDRYGETYPCPFDAIMSLKRAIEKHNKKFKDEVIESAPVAVQGLVATEPQEVVPVGDSWLLVLGRFFGAETERVPGDVSGADNSNVSSGHIVEETEAI